MGIPSYFSHIIRNYSNIIHSLKYLKNDNVSFNKLFMDCNSIIYDVVHSNKYEGNDQYYEEQIIKNVIIKIEDYITFIKPIDTIFIAFDGVAPFAKMEQQRTRRYKNDFLSKVNYNDDIININDKYKSSIWNTSAITPGTDFMNKLSQQLSYHFSSFKYNKNKIIVSGSNEPGEGEHKLFEYIRKNNSINDNIALYGLDSDLIMLSIFHLKYCNNIFVFREAQEFIKSSLPVDVSGELPYFLDINHLSNSIINEMSCCDNDIRRVYDYVFLCFLLGNDFLPHFPAMNIRTHGIETLLTIYRNVLGIDDETYIINKNMEISWNNFRKIITIVSKNEHEYLIREHNNRQRFDNYKFPERNADEKEKMLQNIPIIYRGQEYYISPETKGWENRYYKTLFNVIPTDNIIKEICINYMEALEWVFLYYTSGCVNWRWKYNYNYPPLFTDLLKYIPHFKTNFIKKNAEPAFNSSTQLAYVIPKSNHFLLKDNVRSYLNVNYKNLYKDNYKYEWAYCRYFWESHPLLPHIDIELLNNWDKIFNAYDYDINK